MSNFAFKDLQHRSDPFNGWICSIFNPFDSIPVCFMAILLFCERSQLCLFENVQYLPNSKSNFKSDFKSNFKSNFKSIFMSILAQKAIVDYLVNTVDFLVNFKSNFQSTFMRDFLGNFTMLYVT